MSAFYTKENVLIAAMCTMTMFITLTTSKVFTKTVMTYFGGFLSMFTLEGHRSCYMGSERDPLALQTSRGLLRAPQNLAARL